jgi:hypothetical protein
LPSVDEISIFGEVHVQHVVAAELSMSGGSDADRLESYIQFPAARRNIAFFLSARSCARFWKKKIFPHAHVQPGQKHRIKEFLMYMYLYPCSYTN